MGEGEEEVGLDLNESEMDDASAVPTQRPEVVSCDGADSMYVSDMDDAEAVLTPPAAAARTAEPVRIVPVRQSCSGGAAGPGIRNRTLTVQEQCDMFCGRKLRELIDKRTKHSERFAPGEHINTYSPSSLSHHGVYTGTGTVVHYCSDRGKKEPGAKMAVRETCFHMFVCGRTDVDVNAIEYEEGCFETGHTLRLARQSLGKQDFSLLANNCEHFASWCKKGVGVSEQVDTVEEVGKGTISVAGGAAGGGFVAASVGSQTVPVVAGSPYLGTIAQGILQHTTLGGVLSSSGVATNYVIVPATAATVGVGLAIGAVIGGAGYACYGAVKSLFGDDKFRLSFCVLRERVPSMKRGQTGTLDVAEEGLPIYGPVAVEIENREQLLRYAQCQLPGVRSVEEIWYFDRKARTYQTIPADMSSLPRVLSVCLLLGDAACPPSLDPATPKASA
eukprot:Hpha_TRINITY_DN11159_c2_g1::TRINITY_DN11159_c2_g1_i1::g.28024::m.28024